MLGENILCKIATLFLLLPFLTTDNVNAKLKLLSNYRNCYAFGLLGPKRNKFSEILEQEMFKRNVWKKQCLETFRRFWIYLKISTRITSYKSLQMSKQ